MASASIGSDLPRVRALARAWAISFGGTHTTVAPCPSRVRTSRPATPRPSSTAHRRSGPNPAAHTHNRTHPSGVELTVSWPSLRPTS
jgi:hypothetical protein